VIVGVNSVMASTKFVDWAATSIGVAARRDYQHRSDIKIDQEIAAGYRRNLGHLRDDLLIFDVTGQTALGLCVPCPICIAYNH
jgi:hypothetical protein